MSKLNFTKESAEIEVKRIVSFISEELNDTGKAILAVSGGLDSDVVARLINMVPNCKELKLFIVIQSDMDHSHLDNARELAQDLNKELIEIHLETIPHSIVDAMKKADKHEKFHSDGLDTMRMKCSLRTCVLSFYQDHGYTIFGTTNRTEYEMGFFLPFGDGIADIKPILHMYKSQIKKIAEVLGTREKVLKQPASAGFWVGEEDLDDMAWWLYNEKPITEEIISDESIVNYVENLKQQLSTKKIDDILYSLSRHEDHMTISEENSIDIEIVEKFSKLKSASKKFKHREYNKSLL